MKGYKTVSVNEFERLMDESVSIKKQQEMPVLVPAFDRIDAAVCIVSSNEYAPFAGVVIQSIIANANPDKNYDLVILSDDMTVANRNRIEKSNGNKMNISVRVMDISNYTSNRTFYTWAHFTKNTYYRLLTPDIFEKYEKVIYLDSDIVVNHDISELYAIDIEGYNIGAAYDTHVVSYCTRRPPLEQRDYNMKTLHMECPEQYFQCGVSLYNLKKIHDNYPKGYLIEQAEKNKLRWLDQDLVNMLFYGKIKKIPNKWNVMVSNIVDDLDEYHLPEDLRQEYFEARMDPYIVHYAGKAIPCFTSTPDMYEYFWKYARQSVFYEIIIQKMIPSSLPGLSNLEKDIENWPIILLQHNMMYHTYEKNLFRKCKKICIKLAEKIFPPKSKRRYLIRKLLGRVDV